jgi:hypothetical protein
LTRADAQRVRISEERDRCRNLLSLSSDSPYSPQYSVLPSCRARRTYIPSGDFTKSCTSSYKESYSKFRTYSKDEALAGLSRRGKKTRNVTASAPIQYFWTRVYRLSTARHLLFSGQAGISEILLAGHRQGFEFELIAKPIHPLKLIERLKAQ